MQVSYKVVSHIEKKSIVKTGRAVASVKMNPGRIHVNDHKKIKFGRPEFTWIAIRIYQYWMISTKKWLFWTHKLYKDVLNKNWLKALVKISTGLDFSHFFAPS